MAGLGDRTLAGPRYQLSGSRARKCPSPDHGHHVHLLGAVHPGGVALPAPGHRPRCPTGGRGRDRVERQPAHPGGRWCGRRARAGDRRAGDRAVPAFDLRLRRHAVQRPRHPGHHSERQVLRGDQECHRPPGASLAVAAAHRRPGGAIPQLHPRRPPIHAADRPGDDLVLHQQPGRGRLAEQRHVDRRVAGRPDAGSRAERGRRRGPRDRSRRLQRHLLVGQGDGGDHPGGLRDERRDASPTAWLPCPDPRAGPVRGEERQVGHPHRVGRPQRQGLLRTAGLGTRVRGADPVTLHRARSRPAPTCRLDGGPAGHRLCR